jgi:DnaK suppressor protein
MTAIAAHGLDDWQPSATVSDHVRDHARAQLMRQRETLLRRTAELAGDLDDLQTPTATLGQGETELATRHTDVELRVALDAASQAALEDVERALARLDDGTYGTCTSCRGSIGEERLLALPQVEHCITCQTRQERGRRR